ncbi:NRDE family protein [Marinifilum flexuosum]|uniref:Transport and Golgi organization protein 2 n=1 Tax=Marinifilum flexuosum TaxID=1117708 RepID=A0A419X3R2_9BACT|nr:NRDE family protein [Marinifilum flexuosum]RKE02352.1 transport and Golgi organization protein 2 [Marinifilum flexuosum]
MCTLTYIPTEEKNFIFTTNRDEDPNRVALPPSKYINNNIESLYPKDPEGNGTWMLCNKYFSVCLLNGAFVKHKHEPPYKKSRGLVVLEYERFQNSIDFILNFDFMDIEPFTMIVVRYENKVSLEEIRWDGSSVHYKQLDPKRAEIWSSSTLYDETAREMRKDWFADWKIMDELSCSNVLNFHKNAGCDDLYNGLLMNRKEMVETTSITQIVHDRLGVRMRYEDLRSEEVTERYLTKEKSLD